MQRSIFARSFAHAGLFGGIQLSSGAYVHWALPRFTEQNSKHLPTVASVKQWAIPTNNNSARILAIIYIVMELSFQNIPKPGLFDRLSTFPSEWNPTTEYLRKLCQQISVFYFEQPWPITAEFKPANNDRVMAYTTVFNLCTQKFSRAERIYTSYQEILSRFVHQLMTKSQDATNVVEYYLRFWKAYKKLLEIFLKIFCYLDRYYLPDNNFPSLQSKAWTIFEQHTLTGVDRQKLIHYYFKTLSELRNQSNLEQSDKLLKISKSFQQISAYTKNNIDKELFEAYIRESTLYYQQKRTDWFNLPCPDYFKNVSALQQNEFVLLAQCIITNPERITVLSNAFGSVLIVPYEPIFLSKDTGLKHMLKHKEASNLVKAMRLLKSYHNVDNIKKELYVFVRTLGLDLFSNFSKSTKPVVYIREFARMYNEMLKFVNAAFPAQEFTVQFRNAMESVLNMNDQDLDIAENLAIYTDQLFKQPHPSLEKQQQVLNVFDCLGSKNVFMNVYERDLSRRLLGNKFRDLTQEQLFISLIKEKCGQIFTQSAEGRIDDYVKAVQFEKNFKKGRPPTKFQYFFKVLSKNHWLSDLKIEEDHKAFDYQWPPEVEGLKIEFCNYDVSNNRNRHLEFLPLLSSAVLIFPLSSKHNTHPYCEVTVDLLQASILIFIDRVPQPILMTDLLKVFRAEQQLIQKQLSPLLGSLLILNEGVYSINKDFACSQMKINFKQVQSVKPVRKESLNLERDLVMQGCIVRIMKIEKKMDIFTLFQKVEQMIKIFKPSMSLLKESVEKLVEKEYLQKDQAEVNVIHYKA